MKLKNALLSLCACLAINSGACVKTKYVVVKCPIEDLGPAPEITVDATPTGDVLIPALDALKLATWLDTVFLYRNTVNQCPAIQATRTQPPM